MRCCLLALLLFGHQINAGQQADEAGREAVNGSGPISNQAAVRNLTKRVDPVYPTLAKTARIQGVVKFQVVITETGAVTDIKLLSGHPLLVRAAKDALQQWQFKPFVTAGKEIPVTALIEVPFTLGISPEAASQEEALRKAYFKARDDCSDEYKKKRYSEAERSCESGLKFADQLPAESKLERVSMHGLAGQVFLSDKKFDEAATQFNQELEIAKTCLNQENAELAYAHFHMALGLTVKGNSVEADREYKEAEVVLSNAREKIGSQFLKDQYARNLKTILIAHAGLMKDVGDVSAAAELEKRAENIH